MPLWRYVKKGMTFSPEEIAAMGDAFQGAVNDLGLGEDEGMRREAVAQLIIDFARADGRADNALRMREAAVRALSGSRGAGPDSP
jgi:hypothetical protein